MTGEDIRSYSLKNVDAIILAKREVLAREAVIKSQSKLIRRLE
jgi:hypothetical protein